MKRNFPALTLLNDSSVSRDEAVLVRCRLAKELTQVSDFAGAREALGDLWAGTGQRPQTGGLGDAARAELLLRVGVLTGWLGSVEQIGQTQEQAKDLISQSLSLFDKLGEDAKAAEAQTELAFCYWREGALDDARVLTREALRRLGTEERELRAWVLVRGALVERSAFRLNDALRLLDEAAPLLAESEQHPLLGRFHQTRGNALQFLGVAERRDDLIDSALLEYTAAAFHFGEAGDVPNRARTENNVGFLLQRLAKFEEAHEHFDRAASLFKSLGDAASVAQVNDSRAQCLVAEGRFAEAAEVSRRAARSLARGDERSLLADALITHGVALARLRRVEEARRELWRAVEIAEAAGDLECAARARLSLIEELDAHLDAETLRAAYLDADAALARTQYADLIARLRRSARMVFEAQQEQGGEARMNAARALAAKSRASAEALLDEARALHPSSRVEFTPEAVAALERVLRANETEEAVEAVRRLVVQTLAAAEREANTAADGPPLVTSDAVETVALRLGLGGGAGFDFARPWADFSLKNETRRFERPFIELALRASSGKISRAANLLGFAQANQLNSLLKTKHPDLLTARTPPVKRRRGIIGTKRRRRGS